MVRLHSLEGVDEETPALEVVGLLLGDDGAFNRAARPEGVSHRTPGVLRVRAKVGRAIFTHDEAGSKPGKGQVHQAVLVDGGLEGVGGAFLVQGQSEVVRAEGVHALIEHGVLQGIRMPDMRSIASGSEDLGIELARGVDASVLKSQQA